MRTTKDLKLTATAAGHPAVTAGGGSCTNTYKAITILTADLKLKPANFIRRTGTLSNELDQVIIPVIKGDIIVELNGNLPISDQNPQASITGWKITHFHNQYWASGERVEITHSQIPRRVIEGASQYHNREGSYFCDGEEQP